ncbi:pyruvate kinase [Candidatus Omnitrophota bacterium]
MIPKTKIIATVGPASNDSTTLRKMMVAGLDVVRLNFSHGNPSEHLSRINLVRTLNKKYLRHIRILQDLEGFRIRIGRLEKPLLLNKRKIVYIKKEGVGGQAKSIPLDFEGDLSDFTKGQRIFIDDGNIVLKIIASSQEAIKCQVEVGGLLKQRKGVNIPGARFKFSQLSQKDRDDINFGIENRVDYIAQSFVRTRKDIRVIKEIIKPQLPSCKIIAKIENRQGIDNIDEIIDESDGIMIARGDMGVCIPIYEIAIVQKQIIKKCNKKRKFVITATQMLESMTEHLRPTRAEVTDVTNAIIDGTNFVMLSAETAAGKYPVQSVDMMNRIIKFTEKSVKSGK